MQIPPQNQTNIASSATLSDEEKQRKRFQQSPKKQTTTSQRKYLQPTPQTQPLIASDIKEHFIWSLVLTILCFFLIGPIFSLFYSRQIRRMKQNEDLKNAQILSHKSSVILMISTILGAVIWVAVLFCSVGLLLFGKLKDSNII
ncbi:unnamed protein product [Didymodactylos carnosus]|uniref:Interferon-induced transmembrane protein n=1 Tax=Didymodactylos carnosus TaxID=1234261 RepID=A0A814U436_9BILA|nr:unnamed protein product [Didymodactylos carnosus]CAF1169621.1 unnamed protein product [Didymodactylos carnosus]CAF3874833.1 unnamed protein product [Didymodactylos carnosus]CAF3933289.1 unnamed protein product [Didymodactylos carnosus]